jgi:hypothetical protein
MEAVAVLHPCVRCAEASGAMRPACSRCPRCWRWLCLEHLPGPWPGPWPEHLPGPWAGPWAERLPDVVAGRLSGAQPGHAVARGPMAGRACPACTARVLGRPAPLPAQLTTRMALISAVSVTGMLASAVSVLVLAMIVGLGGELTVLCMLAAEMTGGALAGRHAERRVDAWLEARARSRRARGLPRAQLLPGRPGKRDRTGVRGHLGPG